MFRSSRKKIKKCMNFRVSGQKILLKTCVTYLGVKLNEFLKWDDHFANLLPKLSRANGMLAKIRHYVCRETLINIYYAIFNSHINYCSLAWGKLPKYILDKVRSLQNNAMRLIYFKNRLECTTPLYLDSKILPFQALLIKNQCLFALDQYRKVTPAVFYDFCLPVSSVHHHETVSSKKLLMSLPRTNTVIFGSNAAKTQVVKSWNLVARCLSNDIHEYDRSKFSNEVSEILLKKFM